MKTSIFRFLSFSLVTMLTLCSLEAQTTIPAGPVSGTWDKSGSPYQVTGNVRVATGQKLTITEGVVVEFQGKYKMDVWGVIQVLGKANDTVVFTATNKTNGWMGVWVHKQPSTNDSTIIDHAKFECRGGTVTAPQVPAGSALMIDTCNEVRISNSRFTNNLMYTWGACGLRWSKGKVYNCQFDNNLAHELNPQFSSFASPGTAGLCFAYSEFAINSCLFKRNRTSSPKATALSYADIVSFYSCTNTKMVNCGFFENGDTAYVKSNADVGAYGNINSVEIHDCFFRRLNLDTSINQATFSSVVWAQTNVKSLKFVNCKFHYHGSFINNGNSNFSGNATLIFQNCEFYKTRRLINQGEGAVVARLFMENCYIHNCALPANDKATLFLGVVNSAMYFINTVYVNNGGTIENHNGTLYMYNCIVANNQRRVSGTTALDTIGTGVGLGNAGTGYIFNSIITGNKSALGQSRSINMFLDLTYPKLYMYNNILEGGKNAMTNMKPGILQYYVDNLDAKGQFIYPSSGAGFNVSVANTNWRPPNSCSQLSNSFNEGINTYVGYPIPALDADGNKRIANDTIDVGPYEIQKPNRPVIMVEPKDTSICQFASSSALFGSKAYGDSMVYSWQESTDGSSWNNIAEQDKNTLTGYKPTKTGITFIRSIITNPKCPSSDTSKAAKLQVFTSPVPNLGADQTLAQTGSITLNPGIHNSYLWSTGATTPTLLVDKNNLFGGNNYIWVKVTASNGCSGSDTVRIYLTPGANLQNPASAGVKVYPNPTENILHIDMPARTERATYELITMDGCTILQGNLQQNSTIHLSSISSGTYILQLQIGTEKYGMRVVR